MAVTIPEGAAPGTVMKVVAPDGQEMNITVPDGVKAGQQIQVMPPASAPVQATVVQQPVVAQTTTMNPVVMQSGPRQPPPLCQPGGVYMNQTWCGPTACLIGILGTIFFTPIIGCVTCCIPCDNREVYLEPGSPIPRDPHNGMVLSDPCAGCNCNR